MTGTGSGSLLTRAYSVGNGKNPVLIWEMQRALDPRAVITELWTISNLLMFSPDPIASRPLLSVGHFKRNVMFLRQTVLPLI